MGKSRVKSDKESHNNGHCEVGCDVRATSSTKSKSTEKCDSSSSSESSCSSSSSSSSCCEPAPVSSVDCKKLVYSDLCCWYKDAVVRVNGIFALVNSAYVAPPGVIPALSTYVNTGNGFFIKKDDCRYIVCPSSLVLIPPNAMGQNRRFPFLNTSIVAGVSGSIRTPNQMNKVSRILVEVFNVNGKGKSYSYDANLVGVDGAGNIALLEIPYKRYVPNESNPRIQDCHPWLKWGCAAEECCGSKVWSVGQFYSTPRFNGGQQTNYSSSENTIAEGRMLDNAHLDQSGWCQQQMILTDIPVYPHNSGAPILDAYGKVIGMSVSNLGTSNGANSEDSTNKNQWINMSISDVLIQRVLKAFYRGKASKYTNHAEVIQDDLGNYLRYKKAYLGVAWFATSGIEYVAPIDANGLFSLGYDATTHKLVDGSKDKQIKGLTVLGTAGSTGGGFTQVPGNTAIIVTNQIYDLTPNSPLINDVVYGDIIVKVNDTRMGNLNKQFAPSLVTWYAIGGDRACVVYRKASENYNEEHTLKTEFLDYPLLMDYPYASIGDVAFIDTPFQIQYQGSVDFPIPLLTFKSAF